MLERRGPKIIGKNLRAGSSLSCVTPAVAVTVIAHAVPCRDRGMCPVGCGTFGARRSQNNKRDATSLPQWHGSVWGFRVCGCGRYISVFDWSRCVGNLFRAEPTKTIPRTSIWRPVFTTSRPRENVGTRVHRPILGVAEIQGSAHFAAASRAHS